MKHKFIPLILLAFGALASSMPSSVQGTESLSMPEPHNHSPGMQLAKGPRNTLEAPLATGKTVFMKLSMDLEELKRCTESKRVEVPVQLFLTDFTYSPTSHPPFEFLVNVDCDVTTLECVLPGEPTSFDSYAQFEQWIKQTYFTNQVSITYDFHVDVQKSAPSLAEQLFFLPPDGYRFVGTEVIDNPKIIPDSGIPSVSYVSVRGNTNATTAILRGKFYLNNTNRIVEHKQVFPHRLIEEKILDTDRAKHYYHHNWLAKCQIISKLTFEESPIDLRKNWPNIPAARYSLVHNKWGDIEKIMHLSCMDSKRGEEIDIKDDRVFRIKCAAGREGNIIEHLIRDSENNLYIVKYRNLDAEKKREEERLWQISISLGLSTALLEYDQPINLPFHLKQSKAIQEKILIDANDIYNKNPTYKGCHHETGGNPKSLPCSKRCDPTRLNTNGYCSVCKPIGEAYFKMLDATRELTEIEKKIKHHTDLVESRRDSIREMMKKYQNQAGAPHPRWEEFSKM